MKKNRLLWIVLPICGILAAAAIAAVVLLLNVNNKESRYYEQMEAAKVYLEDMDYSNMVEAYETAIELRPEDPDAYLALAEHYLQLEKFYDAASIAEQGLANTGSRRLENMIAKIQIARMGGNENEQKIQIADQTKQGEDNPKLLLKNHMISTFAEYCYQQYINEYGESTSTYISEEEGYQMKFSSLNAYAYFRDSDEAGKVMDAISKRPLPNAKPYKIIFTNPQLLFAGYEGYISVDKMSEMFKLLPASALVQEDTSYYLVFNYLNCKIKIETDAQGNVNKDHPVIELYPINLISTWVEDQEKTAKAEEDEKTVKNDVFSLGDSIFTYDVTEIYVSGETIKDLSPLAKCEQLEFVYLYDCYIEDLSPLAECDSLIQLDIGHSRGNLELVHLKNLPKLRYLGFHECTDIDDITCIYGLKLDILHPCGSSVSIEQCLEYQRLYPNCEVWFDYFYPIRTE